MEFEIETSSFRSTVKRVNVVPSYEKGYFCIDGHPLVTDKVGRIGLRGVSDEVIGSIERGNVPVTDLLQSHFMDPTRISAVPEIELVALSEIPGKRGEVVMLEIDEFQEVALIHFPVPML